MRDWHNTMFRQQFEGLELFEVASLQFRSQGIAPTLSQVRVHQPDQTDQHLWSQHLRPDFPENLLGSQQGFRDG